MLVQALRYRPRHWAQPASSDDESASGRHGAGQHQLPTEDLPYKVELWDQQGTSVEVVLAVTASASIGYAAYFAATREHPDRHVTLRHKNSIVSRWAGGKGH